MLSERQLYISLAAVFIILPLSTLKTVSSLSFASALCLPIVIFIAYVVVNFGLENPEDPTFVAVEKVTDWFGAVSIMVFAFQCHTSVLAVFGELALPGKQLRVGDKVSAADAPKLIRRMDQVCALACSFCAIIYLLVAYYGYHLFGDSVAQDVLVTFSHRHMADWKIQAARFCIAGVAIISYPINHFPARLILEDLLWPVVYPADVNPSTGRLPYSFRRSIFSTIAFWASSLGLSLVIDDLGKVFQFLGSTCGTLFIFVCPALMLGTTRASERPKSSHMALSTLMFVVVAFILFSLFGAFVWPIKPTVIPSPTPANSTVF